MGTVPLIDATLPLSMPIQPVRFTNCKEATPRCSDRGSTNPFVSLTKVGVGWLQMAWLRIQMFNFNRPGNVVLPPFY